MRFSTLISVFFIAGLQFSSCTSNLLFGSAAIAADLGTPEGQAPMSVLVLSCESLQKFQSDNVENHEQKGCENGQDCLQRMHTKDIEQLTAAHPVSLDSIPLIQAPLVIAFTETTPSFFAREGPLFEGAFSYACEICKRE